ncbi:unnamed protein product [Victoria cruziana]
MVMMFLHSLCLIFLYHAAPVFPNSPLPYHHHNVSVYDPEAIARSVQMKVEESAGRRRMLGSGGGSCMTGNPIDDCWRCDPNWGRNRQRLADCGIGFGKDALGGRNGRIYVVTDPSDGDAVNPAPGTLRYGVIQTEPLWIVFARDMVIKLNEELIMNSFKTIDGRGANVHIAGGACITIQYVSNIIIHGVHIHDCVPTGNANVRSTPNHYGYRSKSDGDGISIYAGKHIWVDHCDLSNCADGLIDAIMGSTAITISNNYFSHHDEVMLLGHSDSYTPDTSMQVTIAFNRFGERLVQRMPRCRLGYFHIVNNDFTEWQMYAIGGSASPTINSQGNRYIAPSDPNAREVTKRVDSDEKEWARWNWRTEGDQMVNGAFFVPSGDGLSVIYEKASSVEPKSAGLVDMLTQNAGVIGSTPRGNGVSMLYPGGTASGDGGVDGGFGAGGEGYGEYMGMTFRGGAVRSSPSDRWWAAAVVLVSLQLLWPPSCIIS